MTRTGYFLLISMLVGMMAFLSCKKKNNPAPQDCSSSTFPSNTGSATIQVLNYSTVSSDGFTLINTNAGDNLSLAVKITKGTNRAQTLRVYQTDCVNQVGTQITLTGQSNVANDGTISLRNTDDDQIRQFIFAVPPGLSALYLNLEVTESGGGLTYHRVKLVISGSGIIESYTNIALGGGTSTTASRLSTGTGWTYASCDAANNMDYIDITYAVATNSYLCSNPARFLSPISLSDHTASCGDNGMLQTDGGNHTYFRAHIPSDFPIATDVTLAALTVVSTDPEYIQITTMPSTFEFLNSYGKKGLIQVTSGTLNNTAADITVSVKVQP
ncbi:MAG TPA: hypothetical protein VNB90_10150 [Cytophagaceae bacterium]|jgi:hypothetical protein|nr:hypothetical protein [Cytophagaceae bacterium]